MFILHSYLYPLHFIKKAGVHIIMNSCFKFMQLPESEISDYRKTSASIVDLTISKVLVYCCQTKFFDEAQL